MPPTSGRSASPGGAGSAAAAAALSPVTELQIGDAILRRVADNVQRDRLAQNRAATGRVEYEERTARELLVSAFTEFFDLLAGRLAFITERRLMALPIHARAPDGFCVSRHHQNLADMERNDIARELKSREQGKQQLAEEQERVRGEVRRREEARRRLREDMVGFRAAGVFLIAEEGRQRAMLADERLRQLGDARKLFSDDEFAAMKAVAAREAREEAARQEVIAAAKREAASLDEKRMAEVHRRQQKLIGRCTHARNGTSVFVGPYPKKMCLICRIKLDPISGLYIIMEGKGKAS
jgi:hypothetical protein